MKKLLTLIILTILFSGCQWFSKTPAEEFAEKENAALEKNQLNENVPPVIPTDNTNPKNEPK